MKRRFARPATLGAALVLVFAGAYWVCHFVTLRAQSAWQPFTATVMDKTTHGSAGTANARIVYYTVAMREDGSSVQVRRVQAPDGTWGNHRTITNLSAGKRVFVDDLTKSISTIPLGEKAISRLMAQIKGCGAITPSSSKPSNVLGFPALETSSGGAIPQKRERFTVASWRTPDLGCFQIEQTATWTMTDGTVQAQHTIKALTVVTGEPSPALFAVPVNYTERSPGEILRTFALRYNTPDHPETDARADRNYQSARTGTRQ